MSDERSEPPTDRRRLRRAVRFAPPWAKAILLWLISASAITAWYPEAALAWVYLGLPTVIGYALRRKVQIAFTAIPRALDTDSADALAIVSGSALLIPSFREVPGVGWVASVVAAAFFLILGILIIGNHERIGAHLKLTPTFWREHPWAAWMVHVFSVPLRSRSALATIYLAMAAVSVTTMPSWVSAAVAVVAAVIYTWLELCSGRLPRTPTDGLRSQLLQDGDDLEGVT